MNQKYSLQDKIIKYFPEEIARLNNKIGAMEEDTIKLYKNILNLMQMVFSLYENKTE